MFLDLKEPSQFHPTLPLTSHVAVVVKNPPISTGDKKDVSSIPGSRRSPGVEMATPYGILAWKIL